MDFSESVWSVTRGIPRGRVTTYSEVARVLGSGPRAVGQALKRNPFPGAGPGRIPCHRVVRSDGSLGGYRGGSAGGLREKAELLRKEGIEVGGGRIELERFFCRLSRKL
jgi:O-6-methylguanine DNA methyltransferase